MADEIERNGQCLCGAVRVYARTPNVSVGACHCSTCRKWGGGPLLGVDAGSDVRFEGAEKISVFESSAWAERGFCSRCGTHLFYRLKKGQSYFLPVGLLDGTVPWFFDHQIFVDERPSYYAFSNATKDLTGPEVFAQFAAPS